jgi:hypothetical protein
MQDCVEPTLDLGLYWERFLDRVFIGRMQLRMQWTLSEVCQRPETTFVSNIIDSTYLTIAEMGPRFVRTASTNTRKLKICCSSSGVFLIVDRS